MFYELEASLINSREMPPFSHFLSFLKPTNSYNQMLLQDYTHTKTDQEFRLLLSLN